MKRFKGLLSLLSAVLLMTALCGCRKEGIKYENTYIPNQDFQYMHYNCSYLQGVDRIETEDGYYALQNQYLYYTDKNNMKTVPLCGKAECLHEQEDRQDDCDAFLDSRDGRLGYDGDFIYFVKVVYHEFTGEPTQQLYRVSMDGAAKDVIAEFPEEVIKNWIVHRGTFYYIADIKGADGKEHPTLKCCPLDNTDKVVTCASMDNVYNGEGYELEAYGNYVYYYVSGFNKDIESDLTENWTKTLENCWICYNIESGETKELFPEQKENGDTKKIIQSLYFWQDKIITHYFDLSVLDKKHSKERKASAIYQFDLDGENPKELLQAEDMYDKMCADRNYLYVYNFWRDSVDKGKEKPVMKVYDKQCQLVDTIEMPMAAYADIIPGGEQCFFSDASTETKTVIVKMDKDKIGTYKGGEMIAEACYEVELPNREFGTVEEE